MGWAGKAEKARRWLRCIGSTIPGPSVVENRPVGVDFSTDNPDTCDWVSKIAPRSYPGHGGFFRARLLSATLWSHLLLSK